MKRKKWMKKGLAVLVCLITFISLFAFPKEAQASTVFKKLSEGSVIKAGSLYLKMENGGISYSETKTGTYLKAGFKGAVYSGFSDGTVIYAVEDRDEGYARLSRYTIAGNKLKSLKKLSYGSYSYEHPGWSVSAVYKNAVFLTRKSFEEWTVKTYVYNTATGKFARKAKNCAIESRSSKYLIARNEYQSDVSARAWSLYKTTSNGKLTKLKKLGTYVSAAKFVGGKVYYGKCTNSSMTKAAIYCCDRNGTNAVKLGTVSFAGEGGGQVVIADFTSKYCTLYNQGIRYKYIYDTKELEQY